MKFIKNYEKEEQEFNSSMLEIGEMMEVIEDREPYNTLYNGTVLLKAYGELISLNYPCNTWEHQTELKGRKLEPGESVTLIQE